MKETLVLSNFGKLQLQLLSYQHFKNVNKQTVLKHKGECVM